MNTKKKQKFWHEPRWEAFKENPGSDLVLENMIEKSSNIPDRSVLRSKGTMGTTRFFLILIGTPSRTSEVPKGKNDRSKIQRTRAVTCTESRKFQFRSAWCTQKADCRRKPKHHLSTYRSWVAIRARSPGTVAT